MTPFNRRASTHLIRAWAARSGRKLSTLPHPRHSTTARASGPDALRLLLIGSAPAVGFGVLTPDLALAGQLARSLSGMVHRGVDIDVIVEPTLTLRATLDALAQVRLGRYHAILVTVGTTEAVMLASEHKWRAHAEELVHRFSEGMIPGSHVFLTTVCPIPAMEPFLGEAPRRRANEHGEVLSEILTEVAEGASNVSVIQFPATLELEGELVGAHVYEDWASALAEQMVRSIPDVGGEEVGGDDTEAEERRQRSLAEMKILDTPEEERFTRIATMAQELFGTASAALTFIDNDRQWLKARVGVDFAETPRAIALCDETIRGPRAFVVPNAPLDPRFADNPLVTGPEHLRFYAGYPIESETGERVGALCVFDTRPRTFSAADTVLLRDLAVLVQRELVYGYDREIAG